jgi:hypothetical protein
VITGEREKGRGYTGEGEKGRDTNRRRGEREDIQVDQSDCHMVPRTTRKPKSLPFSLSPVFPSPFLFFSCVPAPFLL